MKYLFFLCLSLLLITGCAEDKTGFEVMDLNDENYLKAGSTDTPVRLNLSEAQYSGLHSAVKQAPAEKGSLPFTVSLYINEEGGIDKAAIIEGINPGYDKQITGLMKNWKFIPAQRNGKNVKYMAKVQIINSAGSPALLIDGAFVNPSVPGKGDYHVSVDRMPEPIGGMAAFSEHLRYPEIAKRAGIEGKVIVMALINTEGIVDTTVIIKGVGTGLDEAAADAVKQVKFKPGMHRGKAVNVQVAVPIVFKLQ